MQNAHAEIRQAAAYGFGVMGKYGGDVYAQTCAGKFLISNRLLVCVGLIQFIPQSVSHFC